MSNTETSTLPNPFDLAALVEGGENDMDRLERVRREELSDGAFHVNFPCFWPVAYHSIETEVAQIYKPKAKLVYRGMLLICVELFLELIGFLFGLSIDSWYAPIQNLILSLFKFIFGTALILYTYYYPIYCAFRDERFTKSVIVTQVFVIMGIMVNMIGFKNTGSFGFVMISKLIKMEGPTTPFKEVAIAMTIWDGINLIIQCVNLYNITVVKRNIVERNTEVIL